MNTITSPHMRLALVLTIAHLCHHLCTATLYPMLPFLRDGLALNYFQAGLLVSAFSMFYGFGQIPMAMLADRMSRPTILIVGLVGTSLMTLGVGITGHYWQMLLCFALLGLLGASYHAPASSFLSERVPLQFRGRTLGTHTIGGCAGYLTAPVLAVALAHWTGNWRWAFIVLAVPALFWAALLLFGPLAITQARGQAPQPTSTESFKSREQHANPEVSNQAVTYGEIIRKIGVLACASILISMANSSVTSFLPLYLVDHHGVAPESAGLLVALVFGAGIIGAPVGGALSDKLGRKAVILLSISFSGPLLYLVTIARPGPLLILFLLAYGTATVARAPVLESLIADVTPPHRRATVLGYYYLASQETAGVMTPLVGYLIDTKGPSVAFLSLALAMSAAGILAVTFRKKI